MLIKLKYHGYRKEKSELHCLSQSNHLLQNKELKLKYLPIRELIDTGESFYRLKTKKPTRVVLKAPFHYKTGKHRLTLLSYRYGKDIPVDTKLLKTPRPLEDILGELSNLVADLPISGTTIIQSGKTKLLKTELIDKNFFKPVGIT